MPGSGQRALQGRSWRSHAFSAATPTCGALGERSSAALT